MKKSISLLLLLLVSVLSFAQDKIYTRLQKTPIEGEVVEVNTKEVKYKPVDRPLPIISIDKQDVIKIVYKNGQTLAINNPMKDFAMYREQHLWNIKLNLMSPSRGYTQLFLEHSLKPGRSVEYELNLIGLGIDQDINDINFSGTNLKKSARGAGVGIGIRFLRLPDYVDGQLRLRHVMQGSYIKPSVSFNVYSRNFLVPGNGSGVEDYAKRATVVALHPNITVGRQWILDNTFSLDLFGFLGYSLDNIKSNQRRIINDAGLDSEDFASLPSTGYGYSRMGSGDFGLTFGGGIRVGFLFDFKKNKNDQ